MDLAWEPRWRARLGPAVTLAGPAGPLAVVALAVGPVLAGVHTSREALHAVAEDAGIYRVRADLRTDHRIELAR